MGRPDRAPVPSVFLIWRALVPIPHTLMAAVAWSQPYARPGGGLPSAFSGHPRWAPLALGLAASLAMAGAWRAVAGPISAVAAIL